MKKLPVVIMLLFIGVVLFVAGCTQKTTTSISQPSSPQVQQGGAGQIPQSAPSQPSSSSTTPRVIKLEAYSWGFNPSTITVKKGETIKLEISATSETHSLTIQGYNVNSDTVSPGHDASVTFTADKVGTFEFFCSTYCGEGHNSMTGKLVVTE
ncbi:MAG: cupredoxin domain-containing protein [Candidatus Woesearchaeota archaeon]